MPSGTVLENSLFRHINIALVVSILINAYLVGFEFSFHYMKILLAVTLWGWRIKCLPHTVVTAFAL